MNGLNKIKPEIVVLLSGTFDKAWGCVQSVRTFSAPDMDKKRLLRHGPSSFEIINKLGKYRLARKVYRS